MPLPSLGLLLCASTLAAPGADRLHVSPQGNDAWSGRLATPNAGLTDGPLATPARAQAVVRAMRAQGLKQPVEVVLHDGTWYLSEPLRFTPEDSGTATCPITWKAADGAKPVLSGGVPLSGWKQEAGGVWGVDVPESARTARLLRVGDAWGVRARHPNLDPNDPYGGQWAFAQFGGEPWERGQFNLGVTNTHAVGTRLHWTVQVPAAGKYRVWLRYGHKMSDYGTPEMGGRTALRVDGGEPVPLTDLPDTGGWNQFRWSPCATLDLTAGKHALVWENLKGGGIDLDAFALCTDPGWDPAKAIGQPTWWGACDIKPPAAGQQLLLIQCETCEQAEGKEVTVPKGAAPGTTTHLTYAEGALPAIADASGAEVHLFIAWGWVNAIVPVESIDPVKRRLIFAEGGAAQDVRLGNRFFIENVPEALDAPGEWYLDRKAGRLRYLPTSPDFARQPTVLAVLDRIIEVAGEPGRDRWVEHLRFEGLTFRDATYTLTRDYYTPSDGAVRIGGARYVAVTGCDFARVGGYAIHLEDRSTQVDLLRNQIHGVGEGGIHLVGATKEQPHHCRIAGNTIQRIGLIWKHVAGVYLTHGSDHWIAHNRITDTPRYAISLKSQGEDRLSHRNVVEYNDIRRTNLETNDTGAIESLGYEHRDSGNVIRYNRILDSVGLLVDAEGQFHRPHFSWGVYLDDYSSGTTVYGNIIARNVLGGVCIHGGQNNVIENNILVDGSTHEVRLQPRDAFMQGNRFERNIVVWSRPEADIVYSYNDRKDVVAAWDHNLYWLKGGDPRKLARKVTPQGTWAQWLAAGFDAHSVIADPRFVDPEHDDYRLAPDSPALALGFKPIPVGKIGPEGWDGQMP